MLNGSKILISITFFLLIAAINASAQNISFGPLFDYTDYPQESRKHITALGPLFIYKTEDHHKEYGLRPLFYDEQDFKRDKRDIDILYPFAGYSRHENNKHFNVLS